LFHDAKVERGEPKLGNFIAPVRLGHSGLKAMFNLAEVSGLNQNIWSSVFAVAFCAMVFLMLPLCANAQENCANGVDDNGNGLIDLNDPDCVCTGFSNTTNAPSLIPNASFEQTNCCPSTYSQVNCAAGWIQATSPTSDYMNTCGFVFGAASAAGLVPFPDGNGILGAIFSPGWQEYVGSCLSSTMTANNNYQLTFSIASTPIDGSGGVCNGGTIDFEPIDIVIYGNASCNGMPVNTNGCPSGANASWSILGSVNYVPVAAWDVITVNFTPTQNINAVIIGSPCTLPPSYGGFCYPYFYFDNLILNETAFFNSLTITPTGDYCSDNVVLTASSDSAGGVWQWYREGVALVGQTSAVLNVSANNLGTGTFQARYTLNGQCEVTDILLEEETVTADFTATTVCQGTATQFTDASTITGGTIDTWQWNFGYPGGTSGQQSPAQTFPSGGVYDVSLTASLGVCSHTVTRPVTVHYNPVADFQAAAVCLTEESFLEDRSTAQSGIINAWTWDLDDLTQAVTQDVLHTYGASGTYNVELSVQTDLGCQGTVVLPVVVHAPPVAAFAFQQACEGQAASFTDQSGHPDGVTAWQWDFGDGGISAVQHPQRAYTTAGQYDAELVAFTDFGCSDTVQHQVTVYPRPQAGFVNDTVCAELVLSFTDTSVVSSGSIVSWSWDFTDGGTSVQQHPSHVFQSGGTYNVSLTATTDEGCVDVRIRPVVVHPKPVAGFSSTNVCLNEASLFTDASAVATGSIVQWEWDLDDGGTSAAQDTTYSYQQSGIYSVTLMVETAFGCRDTVSQQAEVFDLPVAAFSVSDVCRYDAAAFFNISSIPSGSIVQHLWDLDDGTQVNAVVPAPHDYGSHGTYDVQLIVESDHACLDTANHQLEIFAVPVADFTFDTVCFPLPTTFTDLSTIPGQDQITAWAWQFGDGQANPVDQHPVHTYAAWGDYEVRLTVTSEHGCVDDTMIGPARVHPQPTAIFRPNMANCHQDSTYFEDLSSLANYPNDSLVQWAWQFGDGSGSASAQQAHLYADEGFYDVTLTVTSNHGCEDDVTHPVEIYPLPRVAFSVDTTRGCQPFRAQFFDQTTIPSPYNLASWQWDFGDGTDSVMAQFPVHTYLTDTLDPFDQGVFTVGLTVISGKGCVSSATYVDYMTEYPKPDAWFDVDPRRAELLFARMQVTDLSSPNVIAWEYGFGDGSWYDVQHPFHVYQDTGTYTIMQFVSTQFGCLDTAETMVKVDPEFYFYIPNTFTPNSDSHNQTFFGTGVGVVSYQMVIFDRWGSQVFESNEMGFHWDGTKNGHAVQQGVYAYIFNIVDINGDPHQYVGHVNLVR
jgi:gliding motility-associated-like protein